MTNLSLRVKIFLSMIGIVLISSILMALVTIVHYKNENERYHHRRLERKQEKLQNHINTLIYNNKQYNNSISAIEVIDDNIETLKEVHNLSMHYYSLDGILLKSSDSLEVAKVLNENVLGILSTKDSFTRTIENNEFLGQSNLYSYSIIYVDDKKTLILYLPYTHENSIFKTEIEDLLLSFAEIYLIILLGAVLSAFLVSRYITQSLKLISSILNKTDIDTKNIIKWDSDDEIGKLVLAYNKMIVQLEESAKKLIQSEKEDAWREMAKQVAHEIKNPLTPMRLEVQLLERNAYKIESDETRVKILNFSKGMLIQIDTLSRIANEFSNFAKMPEQKLSKLDFANFIENYSKLHSHTNIKFDLDNKYAPVLIDEKQFSRVLNNLIKNAHQAIPEGREKEISLNAYSDQNEVTIKISDNGIGIKEEEYTKIFEPKFTTKDGGMGLGLSIVKNIIVSLGGKISFVSQENQGTEFTIVLPIEKTKNGV